MAVFEVIRPNRCKAGCQLVKVGRYERWYKGGRLCPSCEGSGVKPLSGRKIADALLVDECNYRRLWKSRYQACYAFVADLDQRVGSLLCVADRREDFGLLELGC